MGLVTKMLTTASLSFLVACAGPHIASETTALPLNRAWFDGHKVEYITTDISDASMAQMVGVNFVPRLADAITHGSSNSILERVYKFPGGEQISIFQSAPSPTGAGNLDRNYSPLWRLVMVRWLYTEKVRELKSEAELLAAEDLGEVSLQVTDIVANCPVTRGFDGQILKGGR